MANPNAKTKKQGNLKPPTEKQLAARAKFALAAKQRANKGEYNLSVLLGGNVFETKTNDLKSALLELKPEKITNRVKVTVEKGGKTIERLLFVAKAKKVFNNGLSAQFFAKSLMNSLN